MDLVIYPVALVVFAAILYIAVRYTLTKRYIVLLNRKSAALCVAAGYEPIPEPYELRQATLMLCVWIYSLICSLGGLALLLKEGTFIPTWYAVQDPTVIFAYTLVVLHFGLFFRMSWVMPRMRYSIRWKGVTEDF